MTAHAFTSHHENAPVVAVHSSASSGQQWNGLADHLAGRFDVSAPDLPGYGGTPRLSCASSFGVAAVAEPIIDHIAGFGRPVHLVGHSHGAGVALKIAMMRPELVKSLTVYEPATFHFLKEGDQEDRARFRDIASVRAAVAQGVAQCAPDTGMRTFIDFWNGAGSFDRFGAGTQAKFAAMAPVILGDFAHGLAESWTLGDLKRIACPMLVLMGMDSPAVAQHVAVRIAEAVDHARLAMLPGLGHMAPVFEPDWVNPRIFEHIAGVERPVANCYWPQRSAA
ncbi:alpha/beta fold hydrolase [Hoeflea poritis]|uniref:Alpha/beta hydrolase n=1 Tax=Hoeflea poritis TaxID=2993659 RepID=A0ABT4VM40_9HYPH|nr:alpha/beta hydrolase [Hoeflea poritis]MDA4845725.1 alpha/beta hydrolase [Hoeflea poritis]